MLYELLRAPDDVTHIIVLGKPAAFPSFRARLLALATTDGATYLGLDPADVEAMFDARVIALEADLDQEGLGLSEEALTVLTSHEVRTFFHGAAATTFKTDAKAKALVDRVNVKGTERVLGVLDVVKPARVVYVSSAYSAGRIEGRVGPSDLDLDGHFPNPYQTSKAVAEQSVRAWGERTETPVVVVRPATIGGRLLEAPRGHVPKYDVFLGWAKAMLLMKAYFAGGVKSALASRIQWDMRLHVNFDSGLNIVPCDWCAKQVAWLLRHEVERDAYHLANPLLTAHPEYVTQMIDVLGIDGLKLQADPVDGPTDAEQFYIDRLGHIYAPYVEAAPLLFDLTAQEELVEGTGIPCPRVDAAAFADLLAFARERDFGLEDRTS